MLEKRPLEAGFQRLVDVVAENYARRAPTKTVQYLFSPLSVAEPSAAAVIVAGSAPGWPHGQPALMGPQGEAEFAQVLPRLPAAGPPNLQQLESASGNKAFD